MAAFWQLIALNWTCLIIALFVGFPLSLGLKESCLQECSILQVQKHIQTSRHNPVCVIFSKYDEEYVIEKKLCTLLKHVSASKRYASWNFDLFKANYALSLPVEVPDLIPTLRCYLTPVQWHDYIGNNSTKHLNSWFQRLISIYDHVLPEASLAKTTQSLHDHELTALGFYSTPQHGYLESLLMEIKEVWKDKINILIAHPDCPDFRLMSTYYSVKQSPSLVFIENSANTHHKSVVQHVLGPLEVNRQQIDLFLLVKEMPVITLTSVNFDAVVLTKTKYYVPILVLFYVRLAPSTLDYLKAFDRLRQDMVDLNANMRFGIMEVNNSVRHVFEKTVMAAYSTKFPFTVLFSAKWNKTTVTDIDQIVIAERPTPGTFLKLLRQKALVLNSKDGYALQLQPPWGHYDEHEITELFEGPNGWACSIHSSNLTDNTPVVWPKHTSRQQKHRKHRKQDFLSVMYADSGLDDELQYIGTLPTISSKTWHTIIEKSHFKLDPYNPDGVWRRQKSKVTLVIFIIAGCGSCTRNLFVFEQIQKSVTHIEGASVYMMNCSQDEELCKDQGITGYPSLVAYRSLGWLDGEQCLSDETSKVERYVRMDYHGVLLVPQIMEWFSEASSEAVINIKFGSINMDLKFSVVLIATVLPRHSQYLPHIPGKHTDYFYPYACYQLVCERLFGQAACVVVYSNEVPQSEYSDSSDMIVTKVVLSRTDGVQTTVAQLGRTLYSTLEEESSASIHRFHRPHRYNIHHQQRCEDDHRSCSDTIVRFVRDHGRLPVTRMTSHAFHTQQSLLFQDNIPVLVVLVHQENITENAPFYKTLTSIAHLFYNELVVVTVDVDEFPAWSGQFVPRGSRHKFKADKSHFFYVYPRLCVVNWNDHQHAAFFPEVKVVDPDSDITAKRIEVAVGSRDVADELPERQSPPEDDVNWHHSELLNETRIRDFLNLYLNDPQSFIVETEHF